MVIENKDYTQLWIVRQSGLYGLNLIAMSATNERRLVSSTHELPLLGSDIQTADQYSPLRPFDHVQEPAVEDFWPGQKLYFVSSGTETWLLQRECG